MLQSGRTVFGNMDAGVFGRATADALIEEADNRAVRTPTASGGSQTSSPSAY